MLVTVTSSIRIGRLLHAKFYSFSEHDTFVGDFVTFASGVKCYKNVMIEDNADIGSGTMIRKNKLGIRTLW